MLTSPTSVIRPVTVSILFYALACSSSQADVVLSCKKLFAATEKREICLNCSGNEIISIPDAIEYLTRYDNPCESFDIIVRDVIEPTDAQAFDLAVAIDLSELGVRGISYELNSTGGDVNTAMIIGKSLYDNRLFVNVKRCFSACVLTLAGATFRFYHPDSEVAIHRIFPSDVDSIEYKNFLANETAAYEEIRSWLGQFGVSGNIVERMRGVPSSDLVYLPPAELEQMGLGRENAAFEDLVRFSITKNCGSQEFIDYMENPEEQLDIQKNCAPETLSPALR